MGVKGGSAKIFYSITNQNVDTIVQIAQHRAERRSNDSRTPVIDIDASWVVRSFGNNDDSNVRRLCKLSLFLVKKGLHVVIVCDGSERHPSKRATLKRKTDCRRNSIIARNNRIELLLLNQVIEDEINVEEKAALQEKRKKLLKETEAKERAIQRSSISVGDDMFHDVMEQLEELQTIPIGENQVKIEVKRALFQADALIAHRSNTYQNDIILCSDSDLGVLTDSHYLAITKFKFTEKSKKVERDGSERDRYAIEGVEISVTNKAMLEYACSVVGLPVENCRHVSIPPYPIFDGISEHRLKVLIATGIGTDYYIDGVPGVTPKVISDLIKALTLNHTPLEEYSQNFIQMFINYWKVFQRKSKQVVSDLDQEEYLKMFNTFVDTMLYEPANEEGSHQVTNRYIHEESPMYLHSYIRDFACNDESISKGPEADCSQDLLRCVGTCGATHYFFKIEGSVACSSCSKHVCSSCTFVYDLQKFCGNCFSSDSSMNVEPQMLEDNVQSKSDMIDDLQKHGIHCNSNEDIDVVFDIFEAIKSTGGTIFDEKGVAELVKYPIEKTSYLQNMTDLTNISIKDGAAFINTNDLTIEINIDVIKILLSLLKMERVQDKYNCPSVLLMFASQSRVHNGFRLLQRASRHAVDQDAVEIRDSIGKIVSYKNNIAIYLKHKVKASMKDQIYQVEVLFNQHDMIACSCTCKAGSCGVQRILCVHILPVIYQMMLLMFDGLAEHMLEELAHFYTSNGVDNISTQAQTNLRDIVLQLYITTGYSYAGSTSDVSLMLESYKVGTERSKFGPGKVKDKTKIGPLRSLDLRSTHKKAQDIIDKKDNEVSTAASNETNVDPLMYNNRSTYTTMVNMINAVCKLLKLNDKSFLHNRIGYKLLLHRSSCSNWDDPVPSNVMKEMKMALNIANQRERVSNNKKEETDEAIKIVPVVQRKKKVKNQVVRNRFSCCSCGATNVSDPKLLFTSVPRVEFKKITTDLVRKSYYKALYRRDIYLNRLNVANNKRHVQSLFFCATKHGSINVETFNIPWKDSLGVDHIARGNKLKVIVCHVDGHEDETENASMIEEDIVSDEDKNKEDPMVTNEDSLSDDDEREILQEAGILLDLRNIINKRPSVEQDDEQASKRSRSDLPEDLNFFDDLVHNDYNESDEESSICEDEDDDDKVILIDEQYCLPTRSQKEWWYHKCDYKNCKSVSKRLKRIASPIKHSKTSLSRTYEFRAKMIRKAFREECLERIGVSKNDKRKCVHICYYHRIEEVTKEVKYRDLKNKWKSINVIMNVPVQYKTSQNICHRVNRGTGRFRAVYNRLKEAQNNIEKASTASERADLVERMMYQKNYGIEEDDNNNKFIDSEVSEILGIKKRDNDYDMTAIKVVDYLWHRGGQMEYTTNELDDKDDDKLEKKEIMFRPSVLTRRSHRVKENTGFSNVAELIAASIIISNGNLEVLQNKTTYLSWFESWYLYFNVVYGRASYRWCDTADRFRTSVSTARRNFHDKMATCMKSKASWPLLATYEEDKIFRKDQWNIKEYNNKRIIMHDNTNIDLYKPGCGDAQRLTYSSYYNGNVGKGSVSIQPCNWITTFELYMGAITDTDYIIKSEILEQQQIFSAEYDNSVDVPWYNILDRGYRVTHEAWKVGKQHVYQPTFAGGTKRFTGNQTLRSGATAAIRSGNERAVNIIKHSHYLIHGLRPFESVDDLCNVWLAWGFQVNFMYEGVH